MNARFPAKDDEKGIVEWLVLTLRPLGRTVCSTEKPSIANHPTQLIEGPAIRAEAALRRHGSRKTSRAADYIRCMEGFVQHAI